MIGVIRRPNWKKSSKHIVSLQFKVTARRGGGNDGHQYSQFAFYDDNNNRYSWPSGTSWSDNTGHYENDPIGNDKMLLKSTPGILTLNLPAGYYIDSSIYTKYGWNTANDFPDRDPISWEFYISEDGINYSLVDTRTSQTITTDRYTLAFRDTYSQ